jgi:hypothetical protein
VTTSPPDDEEVSGTGDVSSCGVRYAHPVTAIATMTSRER